MTIEKLLEHPLPEDDIQRSLEKEPLLQEYRKKMLWILFSLLASFVSIGYYYVKMKDFQPPKVHIVNDELKVVSTTAMRLPSQSTQTVQLWAREAVQKVYTFDFLNYETQLGGARAYFTNEGWDAYKGYFLESSLLKTVKENKLSVAVTPIAKPIIEGRIRTKADGEFAWKVIVPVVVTFSGDTPQKAEYKNVKVLILRTPTTENPKGLGVQQMRAEPLVMQVR